MPPIADGVELIYLSSYVNLEVIIITIIKDICKVQN